MKANNIHVMAIPPHTSHIIQALDSTPFAQFKKNCGRGTFQSITSTLRQRFCQIVCLFCCTLGCLLVCVVKHLFHVYIECGYLLNSHLNFSGTQKPAPTLVLELQHVKSLKKLMRWRVKVC